MGLDPFLFCGPQLFLLTLFVVWGLSLAAVEKESYSAISFCPLKRGLGHDKALRKKQVVCKTSLHFPFAGADQAYENIPHCLCPEGPAIFRTFNDDCSFNDGSACFKPAESKESSSDKGTRTRPIAIHSHLIPEGMAVVGEDAQTHYGSFEMTRWVPNTVSSTAMKGPWLYVIRGRASLNQDIVCVEPEAEDAEHTICSYKLDLPLIKITLQKEGCPNGKVLVPVRCWNPAEEEGSCDLSECHQEMIGPKQMKLEEDECDQDLEEMRWNNKFLDREIGRLRGKLWTPAAKRKYVEEFEPKRTRKVIQKMLEILQQYCPNSFTSHQYIQKLVDLFLVAVADDRTRMVEELFTEEEVAAILHILQRCSENMVPIQLTVDTKENTHPTCKNRRNGGRVYGFCKDKLCRNVQRTVPNKEKRAKNLKKRHAVPEMAYDVLDGVQGICFKDFKASYGTLHILVTKYSQLFTQRLLNWWFLPANDLHLEKLIGVNSIEFLQNVDACIASAYKLRNAEISGLAGGASYTPLQRLSRPTPAGSKWKDWHRNTSLSTMALKTPPIKCAMKGDETKDLPLYCTTPCDGSEVFRCKDGKCIPAQFVCKGRLTDQDSCRDRSDQDPKLCEQLCVAAGNHWCPLDKNCLAGGIRCDGFRSCKDGSDEDVEMCRKRCDAKGGFFCDKYKCIAQSGYCDDRYECADRKDENYCPTIRFFPEDDCQGTPLYFKWKGKSCTNLPPLAAAALSVRSEWCITFYTEPNCQGSVISIPEQEEWHLNGIGGRQRSVYPC